MIARELVTAAELLYPVEFARRASQLRKLGVEVEVLDVKAMRSWAWAPCSVARRARRSPAYRDHALERRQEGAIQPGAFVGKGVCFDTGGISIRAPPAWKT